MKHRLPPPPADLPDDPALIVVEIERHLRAALRTVADLTAELAPTPRPAVKQPQLSLFLAPSERSSC